MQATVTFEKRQEILQQNQRDCPYETFLILEYSPDLDTKELRKTIKQTHKQIYQNLLEFQKPRNLRNKLVRAKLRNIQDPTPLQGNITITISPNLDGRSAACATPSCKCCRVMSRKIKVISSQNRRTHAIPKHANCNTPNVIYLLECTKCTTRNQYVGQTKRNQSKRVAGHTAASKIKVNLPLHKHFNTNPDHKISEVHVSSYRL